MEENKKCPFFCGKVDRDDGVGICCNGMNERYESEGERDFWYYMRCASENYFKCDAYPVLKNSNFES